MIEVSIEANAPWTTGQRTAVQTAVLTFCECNSPDVIEAYGEGFGVDDADAQLAGYVEGYAGYATNAHPDADQFVFTSPEVAQRFADAVRAEVGHLGMTVNQFSL